MVKPPLFRQEVYDGLVASFFEEGKGRALVVKELFAFERRVIRAVQLIHEAEQMVGREILEKVEEDETN